MFSVLQGNLAGLYDVPRGLCAMRRAGVASGVDKESAFDCHMVFRKSALSVNKLFTARVYNVCVVCRIMKKSETMRMLFCCLMRVRVVCVCVLLTLLRLTLLYTRRYLVRVCVLTFQKNRDWVSTSKAVYSISGIYSCTSVINRSRSRSLLKEKSASTMRKAALGRLPHRIDQHSMSRARGHMDLRYMGMDMWPHGIYNAW